MCIFGRLPSNWKNTHHPYASYAYPTGCNRESYEVATNEYILFMAKKYTVYYNYVIFHNTQTKTYFELYNMTWK